MKNNLIGLHSTRRRWEFLRTAVWFERICTIYLFFQQQTFSRLTEKTKRKMEELFLATYFITLFCLQVTLTNHAIRGLTTFRAIIFASTAKRNNFSRETFFLLMIKSFCDNYCCMHTFLLRCRKKNRRSSTRKRPTKKKGEGWCKSRGRTIWLSKKNVTFYFFEGHVTRIIILGYGH